LLGVSIRLTDYDSPELFSPKCPAERELAWKAKLELERVIAQVKLELVPCAYPNNWSRLCAKGTLDGGTMLADHMIGKNLGAPYVRHPGWCPKKRSWCASTAERTQR
jgi:hypothetical protein